MGRTVVDSRERAEIVSPILAGTSSLVKAGMTTGEFQKLVDDSSYRANMVEYAHDGCPKLQSGFISEGDDIIQVKLFPQGAFAVRVWLPRDPFYLTVPATYHQATCLATFKAAHGSEFGHYEGDVTDAHFKNVTTRLVSGQRFGIKVFRLAKTVSSEDCLAFLHSQNAVLVGAQGISLIYRFIKNWLPEGYSLFSFDDKNALWRDDRNIYRTPVLCCLAANNFEFRLDYFERDVYAGSYLLAFYN